MTERVNVRVSLRRQIRVDDFPVADVAVIPELVEDIRPCVVHVFMPGEEEERVYELDEFLNSWPTLNQEIAAARKQHEQ